MSHPGTSLGSPHMRPSRTLMRASGPLQVSLGDRPPCSY